MKLYADDLKIYVFFKHESERLKLETAIAEVDKWGNRWGLTIAPNKTNVLHMGNNNPRSIYKLGNQNLCPTNQIKDLGVIINDNFSFEKYINSIISRAYFKMRQLFHIIKSGSLKTWARAFTAYIRPIVEYSTVIWNPKLKKFIGKIERVQKYFTRTALTKCRLPYVPYPDRLKLFDLPTLELRRHIFDMIMVYKIFNRYTHLNPRQFFALSNRPSRKHNFQILMKYRKNKFCSWSSRITNHWNCLDKEIVNAGSVNDFKVKLIKYLHKNENFLNSLS